MANKSANSKPWLGRLACQSRSERTRQRLIEVAVEVFSDLGFEAASTRTIVERAQANLVSIPYYFGNKLGLYHAVAEYIGSSIEGRFRPACDKAREELQQPNLTHAQILDMFIRFTQEFARMMLGADAPSCWGQFIYREQFDPTEAFQIIHGHFVPLLEVGFEYVSRLTGKPVTDPETRIQYMGILSMVKFTRTDRASVLLAMEWKEFGEEETEIVLKMLRRNLLAIFGCSVPESAS
ncbi:MAG: CerR family C-terminal domain-containing protein [Acidobacteriota bacterium]|nr:CerR family C-terminal domain-containing protein [Acidobacteriota bacterium]